MLSSLAVEKNSRFLRFISLVVITLSIVLSLAVGQNAAAQAEDVLGSQISVTICSTEGSQIILTKPVSDSIVTEATVALEGTVSLASQIEVMVDGAHSGIIPLDMGQTSFSGSVQLTPGTHTIQLVAINVCAGSDATATAVVTYTVPPQTPSTGEETPTTVGGVVKGKPVDNSDITPDGSPALLDNLLEPLKGLAAWLNIDLGTDRQQELNTMSVGRATTLGVGMYLAVIGISPAVMMHVAQLPILMSIFHFEPTVLSRRLLAFSRIARIIGVGLILGALFV